MEPFSQLALGPLPLGRLFTTIGAAIASRFISMLDHGLDEVLASLLEILLGTEFVDAKMAKPPCEEMFRDDLSQRTVIDADEWKRMLQLSRS